MRLLRVVLPLAFTQIVAWGTIYFSFPLFIEPIHRDLGWSRTNIAGGISVALVVSAGMQLVIGRLIARLGAHTTMCVGALLAATSMALLSTIQSVGGYYLAWTLLGMAIALCFFETAFAALLDWSPTRFERSVSVLVLISGLSSTIFLPVTYWLVDHLGWRQTFFCFCLLHLVSAMVSFILASARRQDLRTLAPGASPQAAQKNLTVSRFLRSGIFREPRFWCLAIGFALNMCVITALAIHLFGILAARNFPVSSALGAIALLGPAQILGRVLQTGAANRLSVLSITVIAFAVFLVGMLFLQASTSPGGLVWISIALIGIGSGTMTTLRGVVPAVLFDRSVYAHVSGAIAAPSYLARALAPFGAAIVASSEFKYNGVTLINCVFAASALVLVAFALISHKHE